MKKAIVLGLLCAAVGAQAQIRITEFASGGSFGEYIEITNIGASSIDLTGWSFDDSSAVPGAFSISSLGVLSGGASAIITESDAATFRTGWGLSNSVAVVGLNDQNLSGNGDGMNIFDASNNLVDSLTYTAQSSPTTSNNGPLNQLGQNNYPGWVQSFVGDSYGSWMTSNGDIGNPGRYTPVPEPTTLAVLGLAAAGLIRRRKK